MFRRGVRKIRERSKVTRSRERDLYGTQNPQDIKCMIENLHMKVIENESTREGGEKIRLGEVQSSHPVYLIDYEENRAAW